jgi:hypothetical protein
MKLLALEASVRSRIVLNLMLHPNDFLLQPGYRRVGRLRLRHLVPRRDKGLVWRHVLKARDPEKIVDCTHALLAAASSYEVTTLRQIYSRYRPLSDPRWTPANDDGAAHRPVSMP